jgi:predicted transcriptional regulator
MPKVISKKLRKEIVRLIDEEKLTKKEVAKKLGISQPIVSKYYNLEKGEVKKEEKPISYEEATMNELQEFCRQHNITIVDLAEVAYELQSLGIDFGALKKCVEVYKLLKEVGGEKEIRESLVFLKSRGAEIGKLNEEIKKLEQKKNELETSITLNPDFISEILRDTYEKLIPLRGIVEMSEVKFSKLCFESAIDPAPLRKILIYVNSISSDVKSYLEKIESLKSKNAASQATSHQEVQGQQFHHS